MKKRISVFFLILILSCAAISILSCMSIFDDDNASPIAGSTPDRAILILQGMGWKTGTLPQGGEKWYYFYAGSDSTYLVYLDDASTPSNKYTGYVRIDFYRPDMKTKLSCSGGSHYITDPYIVPSVATERIYIQIAGGSSTSSGTFALKVEQQSNLIE